MIKSVHKDITDDQIRDSLSDCYPGIQIQRLFKNQTMLNSLKVIFTDSEQLQHAVDNKVHFLNMRYQLEKFSSSLQPVRCFSYQKFHNTVAKFCEYKTRCGFCAGNHNSQKWLSKDDTTRHKCTNCACNHPSSYTICQSYKDQVNKAKLNIKNPMIAIKRGKAVNRDGCYSSQLTCA